MANYTTLAGLFKAIADAIRGKTGSTEQLIADNFPAAINGIVTDPSVNDTLTDGQYLLSPYTAHSKGVKITGSMPNQGAKTQALNCGGSYTIPKGFHNGSGKVTANSLASQTTATAAAADIASGKTAWVNGSKITGTKAFPVDVASALQTIWPTDYYQRGTYSPLPDYFAGKKVILIFKSPGYQTTDTSYYQNFTYSDPFTLPSDLDTAATIGTVKLRHAKLTPNGYVDTGSYTNDTASLSRNRLINFRNTTVGTSRNSGFLVMV